MNRYGSDISKIAPSLMLCGAAVSIFLAGTEHVWALSAALVGGGIGMMLLAPTVRPGWVPLTLASSVAALSLLAFLPQAWFAAPAWRGLLPAADVPISGAVCPMPAHAWFWWGLMVSAIAAALSLLASPQSGRQLAWFLHVAAATTAAYALLAIAAKHSGWHYPFTAPPAEFGFLPNRNHTATLLVVGSVLSFGLMQWEATHGRSAAAVFSAFCAAPQLAAILFYSTSRAGVVFLTAGLLIWSLGAAREGKRLRVIVASFVLALFLVGLFFYGSNKVRDRLELLWRDVAASESKSEDRPDLDFRLPVFRDTVRMVGDFPITGAGLGQFRYVFPQYRTESARVCSIWHPESDWLTVAAEQGAPTLVAVMLIGVWFFARYWRARSREDGLLRWTAASAVAAAWLHGFVDVPWHRVPLGWFMLLVVAGAAPSSGLSASFPRLLRVLTVAAGAILLLAGSYLAWLQWSGRPPVPYRWEQHEAAMARAGALKDVEQMELAARQAVGDFPLRYESHYWLGAALNNYLDGAGEASRAMEAALRVDPVLPQVAIDQARYWALLDPRREAEARVEAIRRYLQLDKAERSAELASAGGALQDALRASKDHPEIQRYLLEQVSGEPVLVAHWLVGADAGGVSDYLSGVPDGAAMLDALPPRIRGAVLDRWLALPEPARAVAYMESKGARAYWPRLAGYYASSGDKPRAVALVAEAQGIALDGVGPGPFAQEIAGLEAKSNTVAVRRMLKEALSSKDPEKVAVAMVKYASAGDWESSWVAASRLAARAKTGQ